MHTTNPDAIRKTLAGSGTAAVVPVMLMNPPFSEVMGMGLELGSLNEVSDGSGVSVTKTVSVGAEFDTLNTICPRPTVDPVPIVGLVLESKARSEASRLWPGSDVTSPEVVVSSNEFPAKM